MLTCEGARSKPAPSPPAFGEPGPGHSDNWGEVRELGLLPLWARGRSTTQEIPGSGAGCPGRAGQGERGSPPDVRASRHGTAGTGWDAWQAHGTAQVRASCRFFGLQADPARTRRCASPTPERMPRRPKIPTRSGRDRPQHRTLRAAVRSASATAAGKPERRPDWPPCGSAVVCLRATYGRSWPPGEPVRTRPERRTPVSGVRRHGRP